MLATILLSNHTSRIVLIVSVMWSYSGHSIQYMVIGSRRAAFNKRVNVILKV